MKTEDKKYILNAIKKKSVKQIAQELNIKEKKIRKFLQKQDYKKEQVVPTEVRASKSHDKKVKLSIVVSLLAIIVLGFIVYCNSLNGKFLWDDYYLIENNIYIRNWSYIKNIFAENIEPAYRGRFFFYRPLQMFTYAIDHSLWKFNVKGYHLTSITLHILVSLSIYWLILLIFNDRALSLITSLFFVAHPIHTEAVTYISGRADSLIALWLLLSFVFYIKNLDTSSRTGYIIMSLSYALALLSRENGLILPVLILFYHFAFKRRLKIELFSPILGLSLLYIILRVAVFKFSLPHVLCPVTLPQRMPGFFVAITNYTRLLFLPLDLHMEYGTKLFPWTYPKAILGVIILISLILCALKKKDSNNLVFFSIGWLIIALLPSSNIYPINAYMAEHWLYIPSIGFFLILAKALSSLYKMKMFKALSMMVTIGLLAFYSYLTVKQNTYWNEPALLYERTLKYAPDRPVLYNNLGILYGDMGNVEGAISLFKKAVDIDPNYVYAYNNLGKAYNLLGNKKEALFYYNKALELYPASLEAHYNIGNIYTELKRYEEAIAAYKKALEISPYYTLAYYNLGNVYRIIGKSQESIPLYKKALEHDPNYLDAYHNLGLAYNDLGRDEEAIAVFKEIIRLKPDFALAYSNLAIVYYYQNNYKLAIENFDKARSLGVTNQELLELLEPHRKQIE